MGNVVTGRGDVPDPESLVAALRSAELDVGAPSVTTRAVLDTFDGLVHRSGLRLEIRDGVLVLSGDGAVDAHLPVARAPRVAADLPPGPFRSRLGEIIEIRALLPQLCVTSRARRAVRGRSRRTARTRCSKAATTTRAVRKDRAGARGGRAARGTVDA